MGFDFGCTGERFIAGNIATEKCLQATGCRVEEGRGAMQDSKSVRETDSETDLHAPHLV